MAGSGSACLLKPRLPPSLAFVPVQLITDRLLHASVSSGHSMGC